MPTPLRFLNDKSGATKIVNELIPREFEIIHSPFFCSGGLEVRLVESGRKVIGYTHFHQVMDFWNSLLNNPELLYEASHAIAHHPFMDEKFFYNFQKERALYPDEHTRGAIFYVLNRLSKYGTVTYGEYMESKKYLNDVSLSKLKSFRAPDLHVSYIETNDVLKIVENVTEDFLICQPPRYSDGILDHATPSVLERPKINHEKYFEILKNKSNWINIYEYSPKLSEMYNDYEIIYFNKNWHKTTQEHATEMVIANV